MFFKVRYRFYYKKEFYFFSSKEKYNSVHLHLAKHLNFIYMMKFW